MVHRQSYHFLEQKQKQQKTENEGTFSFVCRWAMMMNSGKNEFSIRCHDGKKRICVGVGVCVKKRNRE